MTIDELKQRTVLTVPEAAEVLGIGQGSAAYRAAEDGLIPGAFKIGNRWRCPVPPLLRLLGVDDTQDNLTELRAS